MTRGSTRISSSPLMQLLLTASSYFIIATVASTTTTTILTTTTHDNNNDSIKIDNNGNNKNNNNKVSHNRSRTPASAVRRNNNNRAHSKLRGGKATSTTATTGQQTQQHEPNNNNNNNKINRNLNTASSSYPSAHSYYPDHTTATCLDSRLPQYADYEEWMAWEGGYAENHFFGSAEECCERWFGGEASCFVGDDGGMDGDDAKVVDGASVGIVEAFGSSALHDSSSNNNNNSNNDNNNNKMNNNNDDDDDDDNVGAGSNSGILDGMTQSLIPLSDINPQAEEDMLGMSNSLTSLTSIEETQQQQQQQQQEEEQISQQSPENNNNNNNNNNNGNDGETFPTFSCGTGWASAAQCTTLCLNGMGCPDGQSCYAGIPCPSNLVANVMNANGDADEGILGYIDSSGVNGGTDNLNGVSTNVCGLTYEDAQSKCLQPGGDASTSSSSLGFAPDYTPCPSGSSCPPTLHCYGGILCPPPPTISPSPTRSPIPDYEPGGNGRDIIGYYAAWQWYDRTKLAQPRNIPYGKLTRVNYAFFQTDEGGSVWGTDEWADPRILFGDVILTPPAGEVCNEDTAAAAKGGAAAEGCFCHWSGPAAKSCFFHDYKTSGLIHLAQQQGVEVYPSIGGWTLSDAFPGLAASSLARKAFARNCVDLIVDYGFDGIDIDWEYPGYAEHSGTPNDGENFKLLLTELRQALDELGESQGGRYYGITAALPCGPANIANQDVAFVANILDGLNLMTYDFHGAWDAITGVNAPLYDQEKGDPESGWSVHGCVENWVGSTSNNPLGEEQRSKVNIGLPFYGRSYLNAKELYSSHGGLDELNWKEDDGSPQYFNLMARMGEMTSVRDDVTMTQIAYFDNGMGMVTYDDERAICDKTEYAMDNGLGGFIIWEISGDMMDDLHTPLLDAVNRKLAMPEIDCEETFPSPEKITSKVPAADVTSSVNTNTIAKPIIEVVEEPLNRKDKTEVVGIPPKHAPVVVEAPAPAPLPSPSNNESPYTVSISELGSVSTAAMTCEGGCPSGSTCVGNQSSGQLIKDEECSPCGTGQTWWPCDVRGLCWCWVDGSNRIAPAPESGIESQVADLYTVCDDILTRDIFNTVAPEAREPYSYTGLCDAIRSYNAEHSEKAFGMGDDFQRRAELAAFLGNTLHESDEFKAGREYLMCADKKTIGNEVYCKPCDSGSFDWASFTCARSLITGTVDFNEYCQPTSTPPEACNCGTGKGQSGDLEGYVPASALFFGRGAIQLSWNYNYIGASVALTGSPDTFCDNPDLVATVGKYAWGAGLYFWMEHVKEGTTSHMEALADGGDFGGTLNNINGGLECPAHGGWHEEAVKARLNRYCRAAKALGLPNLMNLGGCAGLEDKMSSCLAAGTCNDCQEFVGTTPGDHVINFTPPAHSPVTTPLQQVTIEEPTNPCGEGLMQLQGHPDCCVPNTAFIGDGACDSYEPYNTEVCGWDGGDCCKETCNIDSVFGCKAKVDGEFGDYGPFGFFCLDPSQPSAINPNLCSNVERERIGDGKCNPGSEYNNPECNYDGGDCCAETCDDTSSFYDCGSGSQSHVCRDPRFKADTTEPTTGPTNEPTKKITNKPTKNPTNPPTATPLTTPTDQPTKNPRKSPTPAPESLPAQSLSSSQFANPPSSLSNQFVSSPSSFTTQNNEGVACQTDIYKCESGVYVRRDFLNDCKFETCPDVSQEKEQTLCASDVKKCDNGVYVPRDPSKGCEFSSCPDAPQDIVSVVQIDEQHPFASSLSSMLHGKENEISDPIQNPAKNLECSRELLSCGVGVFVAKDPNRDCNFFPCPSNISSQPSLQPVNQISMASAVHSKYGDKMPISQSAEIEPKCAQELFQCPSHTYLFVGLNPSDSCNPFRCPSGGTPISQSEDSIAMAASTAETASQPSVSMAQSASEAAGKATASEEASNLSVQTEESDTVSMASAVHSKYDDNASGCARELYTCSDGSHVGRDPDDNCQFFPCPSIEQTSSSVCTNALQKCSDGSFVGQNPDKGCQFFPCAQLMSNSVTMESGGTHHEFNLKPADDASIRETRGTTNYNSDDDLKLDADSGKYHALIRFDISELSSVSIQTATLKLYATDSAARSGGMVEGTDGSDWDESTVTWDTAPKGNGDITDVLGPVSAGAWYELNVVHLLRNAIENGYTSMTLRLSTKDSNRASYASKEYMDGKFSPRLIVDVIVPSTMTSQVQQEPNTQVTESTPLVPEVVSSLGSTTIFASDDSYIDNDEPSMAFGATRIMQVDRSPHEQHALVRFDVSGINFNDVTLATIHIYVIDTAPGCTFYLTSDTDWSENTVTWENAPAGDGGVLETIEKLRKGWMAVDVSSFFEQTHSSDASYLSVRIGPNSDNRLVFSSKEGDHSPKLIITVDQTS